MELTSRERLLRSFRKETVDRVAVAPFIHQNFVKAFFKDPLADLIQGTIDVYRHFGFDLMHRNLNVRYDEADLQSAAWRVWSTEQKTADTRIVTTKITTPERELTQVIRYQDLSPYFRVKAIVERFIKDEADFEQFPKYQPPIPRLSFPDLQQAKQIIGEGGITAPWVSGVFNQVSDYRKLDDLLVDALINPGFFKRMMRYFLERSIAHLEQVTAAGPDVLSYAGNIASGSMVGPRFFREHIFQYEKLLIDRIQSRGVIVLYHNCGDARNMIEVYNDLGISAYESITEPPYADNDLQDALSRFDRSVTLIGNLDQIDFLRQASPEEIRAEVRKRLGIAAGRRGFILGTSDFLDENTAAENLFAMAEAAKICN